MVNQRMQTWCGLEREFLPLVLEKGFSGKKKVVDHNIKDSSLKERWYLVLSKRDSQSISQSINQLINLVY